MDFYQHFQDLDWNQITTEIYSKTADDVERSLQKKGARDLEDFKALVSPAAEPYLEPMANFSQTLTQQRFGNIVQLYIPLYLSNECSNSCRYCGFNRNNELERLTLTPEQVLLEAEVIKNMGFEHVLLVSGESTVANFDYLKAIIRELHPLFANLSIEVQPMEQGQYSKLIEEGLHAVYLYQETYGPNYAAYHPAGKKRSIRNRLVTPDEMGKAGVNKIGLGCLLGLADWRVDSWFVAAHLDYLEKTYWKTRYSISFPRLRPTAGNFSPKITMSDRELVQLICAYRIFNSDVELSISTRESEAFRDHIFKLGVTCMSAGSKTNPGGYSLFESSLDQFQIEDVRPPTDIAAVIATNGYKPVWKDWFAGLGESG